MWLRSYVRALKRPNRFRSTPVLFLSFFFFLTFFNNYVVLYKLIYPESWARGPVVQNWLKITQGTNLNSDLNLKRIKTNS